MEKENTIKRNKIILCVIAVCLIASIVLGSIIALIINLRSDQTENDQFQSLMGNFTDIKVTDADSAIAAAQDAVDLLGLKNAADELTLKNESNVNGVTYYRLQQKYDGIPVYGKAAVVVADDFGNAKGFFSNILDINITKPVQSSMNDEKFIEIIENFSKDSGNAKQIDIASKEMVLFQDEDSSMKLSYRVSFSYVINGEKQFIHLIIDDANGEILSVENLYDASSSLDVSSYQLDNQTYAMIDIERGIYMFDAMNRAVVEYPTKVNKNIIQFVSSNTSEFGTAYEDYISLKNNVASAHDYYMSNFNQAGCGGSIVIANNGSGTFGGYQNITDVTDIDIPEYEDEKIGILYIESGVDSLSTIGHEFTHSVTRYFVDWADADLKKKNELGAINEGYSDLFGILIEARDNNGLPKWSCVGRNIQDPSKSCYNAKTDSYVQYPSRINSMSERVSGDYLFIGDTGQDYAHAYGATIAHTGYLMTIPNSQYNALSLDELSDLWYNTMLTLPSNCTFSVLRENMEMTAKIIGFSDDKVARISAAFDEVGIYNENDESISEYSTEISVQALTSFDGDIKPASQYKIIIEGKEDKFLWFTKDYYNEIDVTDSNPIDLTLEKGEYTISVTDGNNTYSQKIKTRKGSDNKELTFITEFLYVVDIKTPSESDFEAFTKMFEDSIVVWANSDNFTSANLTTAEIIDDYITYYMFCYYLTLFDSDTITKEEADPLNKLYGCRKFEGEKIDWILENIFNKTPDHNSSSEYHYYYDGNWYIEGAQGVGDHGMMIKSISEEHKQISGNKYQITIKYIFDNYHTDETEKWEYIFVTNFNYDKYVGNYWSIESLSKKPMASDTTSNSTTSTVITENSSAEEMRKAIIGRWWAAPTYLYVFNDDGSCKMLYDNSTLGTFEITDDKRLKIKMSWTSENLAYNSNSWVNGKGWCILENGDLVIEGIRLKKQN